MSEQATVRTGTKLPFDYAHNVVISVGVSQLDRSIEWYREVLGFEVSYKLDEYGWCELKTPYPGIFIGLGQTEEVNPGTTTPTFGVKDIAAARKYLESHEVRFDGDTYEIDGMVKLATFYDPDGNSYMLAQNLVAEENAS